jgi:D-amino peptidase
VRVFISADIEGISGLVSWSQCEGPNVPEYDYGRERIHVDVNAAIRGAFDAGAQSVVVKDSHGNSKNLRMEDLEPGVELISGNGAPDDTMMLGLDDTFDGVFLIGYHAKAGTPRAVMEHTLSGCTHRLFVNDVELGEMGISALLAAESGVPILMVSSDEAGCAEAAATFPGVVTAAVKKGLGRYMAHCPPAGESETVVYDAAKEAVSRVGSTKPYRLASPYTVRIEMCRTDQADGAMHVPGLERLDGYTVQFTHADFTEAHRTIWAVMGAARGGG